MEKIDDCLRCPICLEIPVGEIFLCRNGHQICDRCSDAFETCPSCRIKFDNPKIRNRPMEDLLDVIEFDCPFKGPDGCSEKLHRSKLATHHQECKFRPFDFCKLLGYKNCDFDAHQNPLLLLQHLQDFHNVTIHEAQDLVICHDNFMNAAHTPSLIPGSTKFWPPVVIKIDKDNDGPTFIVVGAVGASHCSWICLYMNDSEEETSKYQFSFSIKNVFGNDYELKWKTVPVSFKKAEEVLRKPRLTLPMNFIKDHFLLDSLQGVFGPLSLEIRVSKNGEEPVKDFDADKNPLHLRFAF